MDSNEMLVAGKEPHRWYSVQQRQISEAAISAIGLRRVCNHSRLNEQVGLRPQLRSKRNDIRMSGRLKLLVLINLDAGVEENDGALLRKLRRQAINERSILRAWKGWT